MHPSHTLPAPVFLANKAYPRNTSSVPETDSYGFAVLPGQIPYQLFCKPPGNGSQKFGAHLHERIGRAISVCCLDVARRLHEDLHLRSGDGVGAIQKRFVISAGFACRRLSATGYDQKTSRVTAIHARRCAFLDVTRGILRHSIAVQFFCFYVVHHRAAASARGNCTFVVSVPLPKVFF